MCHQVIPEAAVEAAYCELPDGAGRYVDQSDIRLMLEAAAAHMLGQAWESGWANARGNYMALYTGQEIPDGVTLRNPYGTAK